MLKMIFFPDALFAFFWLKLKAKCEIALASNFEETKNTLFLKYGRVDEFHSRRC